METTTKSVGLGQWVRGSLPAQILICVVLGVLLGAYFPSGVLKSASEVGRMIIHWIKLIAGPFLFLTIVASTVQVRLSAGHAARVISIALLNTILAIAIGLGLAHVFYRGMKIDPKAFGLAATAPPPMQLNLESWLKTLTPTSLFQPFVQNDILLIAILALFTGIALRQLFLQEGQEKLESIAHIMEQVRAVPGTMLGWLIHIIPLAVLTVVAGSVSQYGFGFLSVLLQYVGAVLLGFVLQVTVVYGFWVFIVARMSPRKVFRSLRVPLSYSFGVNSSLATLPLTLKALKELGVSPTSAALGAGVATNINNDGIVLYEAMAVFFIAQLSGMSLTDGQMIAMSVACMVAAMGITGIPEAGFISLSVVVATLGLPAELLPLLLAVDWMLARGRSVVNVLSDITLSIALDATDPARPKTLSTTAS